MPSTKTWATQSACATQMSFRDNQALRGRRVKGPGSRLFWWPRPALGQRSDAPRSHYGSNCGPSHKFSLTTVPEFLLEVGLGSASLLLLRIWGLVSLLESPIPYSRAGVHSASGNK